MSEHRPRIKWRFKTLTLIIAFLCVGPFALPLLWFNPRFSKRSKIIISVAVLVLSFYSGIVLVDSIKAVRSHYQQFNQLNF